MSFIRILLWILLGWFLLWAGKWGYIIYKVHESFLPDVSIPLKLQTGYKYEFEYIPPDASLKQQIPILEIEKNSFDKTYELYKLKLISENKFSHEDEFKFHQHYIHSPPLIKVVVFHKNKLLAEKIVSFDKTSSWPMCTDKPLGERCYRYLPQIQNDDSSAIYFKPKEHYFIIVEVSYADPKAPNLRSSLVLGGAYHFKKYKL